MKHINKGLVGVINNIPISITNRGIIKWNLQDTSIINKINYTFNKSLDNYDVREKDGRIFITDLQKADLYCVEDDLTIHRIVFEDRYDDRKVPKTYLFKNFNTENLVIDTADSYGYYLLNLKSFEIAKYSSILVLKNMPSFRSIYSFFIGNYNTLYVTNNSEKLLYHQYDSDGLKSEVGIYFSADEKVISHFEAPEPINRVNFYTNTVDKYNTGAYSNVKGCLVADKIVLCYQHMLYVLDYNGNVLKTRPTMENSRYWGVDKLNEQQLLIAELDPTNSEKMFVLEYDIN